MSERNRDHEAEEILHALVSGAPAALAMLDHEMRYVAATARWWALLGIDGEQALAQRQSLAAAGGPESWRALGRCTLDGGEHGERSGEDELELPDGRAEWIRWEARPWLDRAGAVGGCMLSAESVTARRATEDAQRLSELRYRSLVENLPDHIVQLDREGAITFINRTASGRPVEEVEGEPGVDFLAAEDRPLLQAALAQVFGHGAMQRLRSRGVGPEGSMAHYDVRVLPVVEDGRVTQALCIGTDITSQVEAEQEQREVAARQRHQQRLDAVSTLAGGVAHEINNPIQGIMSYAELIRRRVDKSSAPHDFATEIKRETQRIGTIIRDLLTFARQDKDTSGTVDVGEIVRATLSLTAAMLRRDGITVSVDVPAAVPQLRCHAQQVQQVLMNLVTNARDALNARYDGYDAAKTIKIGARTLGAGADQRVEIVVEDRGEGIPPELQERLFDPFFSTREPRRHGAGLGLSVSHGIVVEHGGEIRVESEAGIGTYVFVTLPAATPR